MGTRQHDVGRGSGGNGPFADVERCEGRSELSEVSRARTPSLWRRAHCRHGGHPDRKGTLGWVGARRPDRDFPGDTIAAVTVTRLGLPPEWPLKCASPGVFDVYNPFNPNPALTENTGTAEMARRGHCFSESLAASAGR